MYENKTSLTPLQDVSKLYRSGGPAVKQFYRSCKFFTSFGPADPHTFPALLIWAVLCQLDSLLKVTRCSMNII